MRAKDVQRHNFILIVLLQYVLRRKGKKVQN